MIKKSGNAKRRNRRWTAAAAAAAVAALQLAAPAFAAVSEEGRYENYYNAASDLGTMAVTGGGTENGMLVLNTDASIQPDPDEPAGVAELRLTKKEAFTEANFSHEFKEHPVHNFQDDTAATAIELKIRFAQKGNVKKALRLDDTVNGSVTGDYLAEFDDGRIFSSNASGHKELAGSKEAPYYQPGTWYQVFAVLRGNYYDLYFAGQKLNTEPLKASNGSLKAISRIVNYHKTWSDESSYYDDLILQPLTGLALQRSTVADGETSASEKLRKLILDFNTPLNPETVSDITLSENGTAMPAEDYTVALDPVDQSRVKITLHTSLKLATQYEVRYSGLTDILGSASAESLTFTTRETPSPAELESSDPENGAENVSVTPTLRFTMNKEIDPGSLTEDCVTISPSVPVESVTLEDARTVAVTFGKALKPNRTYTAGLNGQATDLEDGMNISPFQIQFTTVQNPNMIVDEFEWMTDGLSPYMIGVTDKQGRVIPADTVTDVKAQLPYAVDVLNPENYDGDTSRIFLSNGLDDSKLIYQIEDGVRDVTMSVYDNTGTTTEGAKYELQFAVAKTLDDLNETSTYLDITDQVKKEQLSLSAKDGFYPYRYTYQPEDQSYLYFIIRMHRLTKDKNSWTPKIANIKFNGILPPTAEVETMEGSRAVSLPSASRFEIPFTTELDDETIRPDYFHLEGYTVTSASLDGTGKKVILDGNLTIGFSQTYALTVDDGILDLYGREVAGGEYLLLTPHTAGLVSASLREGDSLPESGTVTPTVVINCRKADAELTVYAAFYQDDKLAGLSVRKGGALSLGEQTLTLPALTLTAGGADRRIEIFARTDGGRPLPGIVKIGEEAERSESDAE